MRAAVLFVALTLAIASTGCELIVSFDRSKIVDAGPDGGPDAGADAGPDAGPDGGSDAGADGGADAGADGGP